MISFRQLIRSTWFLLFILLTVNVLWKSCVNSNSSANALLSSDGDTLPDTTAALGISILKNFESVIDELDDNLGQDFLYNEGERKASYFKLNDHQAKLFFNELDHAMNNHPKKDSIRIRIYPGLFGEHKSKREGKPNITLLMTISKIIDNPLPGGSGYFLREFWPITKTEMQINEKIPDSTASRLINNWQKVPNNANDIVKTLYPYAKDADLFKRDDRIRYYTFNVHDTYDIWNYHLKHPDCNFYVYFGLDDQNGEALLRVVLRLTPPLEQSKLNNKYNAGNDENFEFSAQCPNLCN